MATVLTRPAPARQDAPFRGQGRSERGGEMDLGERKIPSSASEPLSEARTTLADFFSILLVLMREQHIIGIGGRLRHSRNLIDREGKEGQV